LVWMTTGVEDCSDVQVGLLLGAQRLLISDMKKRTQSPHRMVKVFNLDFQ